MTFPLVRGVGSFTLILGLGAGVVSSIANQSLYLDLDHPKSSGFLALRVGRLQISKTYSLAC